VYAIILDRNGKVLAYSNRDDLMGKVLDDPVSRKAAASRTNLVQEYIHPETGDEIWDIAYPIYTNGKVKWGMVRIGFTTRFLEEEISRNRKDLVILALAAVILAGGIATVLADRISGPVRKLSQGAVAISRGDLSQRISIRTGDEIEELAHTFNSMARELDRNRTRMERLIHQLSTKNRLLKKEIAARQQLEDELIMVERLRALGEMSGGVAHDFNNILGTILGRAELLLEKVHDANARRGIQVIESAAKDGAEIVRRIREFTQVHPNGTSFVELDINQVIENAVEFTRVSWERSERGIQMECMLDEVPSIMGNPTWIGEVITNMILNAVDAMPKGGTLTIRTYREGHRVAVKISDTGVGMSAEVKKRVFDPFFTTKGSRGSGLGLSTCYGIVAVTGERLSLKA
ncbi:MAG: ATP-binding protein, partial [Spirochaetota bacterium]